MLNQFNASIWGDEGFSAILSMKSVPEIISIIARDTSPPLYNLLEHFWFKLFGTSEISIRSLSFVFYLIAIFFAYKIGSHIWNRKTGLIAALLTFLNPFFFIYAFEGRMYSLLAATVIASFYFFISKKWIGYVISATLILYTHHFGVFAVFVQGLWFLKEIVKGNKKDAFSMFKSFVAIGILYSAWLIPLYNQTKMVGGGFWLGRPTPEDLKKLFYDYLGQGTGHSFGKYARYLVLIGLLTRNWLGKTKQSLLLLSWFLIPIILVWLISQKFQSIFYNRYLLYTIPAAMILLASDRRKYLSGGIIALVLFMFIVIDVQYFTHPTKLPFREFAELVKEEKRGDDFLINWNFKSHHLWETKYYGLNAPIYVPDGTLPYFVGTALMEKSDIVTTLPVNLGAKKKLNRIGVITSDGFEDVKLEGYIETSKNQVGDLKIIWLVKK